MATQIETVFEKLSTLRSVRDEAVSEFLAIRGSNDEMFALSQSIPDLGRTYSEVETRVGSILEMASSINPDTDDLLIPHLSIVPFTQSLDSLTPVYVSIISDIERLVREGNGAGQLDPINGTLTSSNGAIVVRLGDHYKTIWQQSDTALSALITLLQAVGDRSFIDYSSSAASFATLVGEVQKTRANLNNLLAEDDTRSQKHLENLAALEDQVRALHQELSRQKEEGDNDRKTLDEYRSQGTDAIANINSANEQAESLRAAVKNYETSFTNFQRLLDEREATLSEGQSHYEKLVGELDELKERMFDTVEESKRMLSGATVAGLAGDFGNYRNTLDEKLNRAASVFYISIAIMFVAVLPLMLYVLPGSEEIFGVKSTILSPGSNDISALEFLGQVAARALLLIPAIWLVRFSAGRHARLFELKEHYAYKYSIAASVEGFKQQAPKHSDEIAAATFFELAFNPAEKLDGKRPDERHPSPVMEWFLKKLRADNED